MRLPKGIIVELTPKFTTKYILNVEVDGLFHSMKITNRKVLIDIDKSLAQYTYDLEEYHGLIYTNGKPDRRKSCYFLKDIPESKLIEMVENAEKYKEENEFGDYSNKRYRCNCLPKFKINWEEYE